jgi:signal transduction histidine kinase
MTLQHQRALDERMARLAAVGKVCAAVAHGIRNPLASISSSAQLNLSSESCSEVARSRLQDILSECRRLDDRVTHLLSFASSKSSTRHPFNLKDVVEQTLAELGPDSTNVESMCGCHSPRVPDPRRPRAMAQCDQRYQRPDYTPANIEFP